MVLVDDNPFAAGLAQPGGETKIDRTCKSAFAMNHARRERDVIAGGRCNLARYEADRSQRVGKKEIPGLVIGFQALDSCRKVEHQ